MSELIHMVAFVACILILIFGTAFAIAAAVVALEWMLLYTKSSTWERRRRKKKDTV